MRLLGNGGFFAHSGERFGDFHVIHPLIGKSNSRLINFIGERFDLPFCLLFLSGEDGYLVLKGFLQSVYLPELLFKALDLESAIVFLSIPFIGYGTKFLSSCSCS